MLDTWRPYTFSSMIIFACSILLEKRGGGGRGGGESQTGLASNPSSSNYHDLVLNLFFC